MWINLLISKADKLIYSNNYNLVVLAKNIDKRERKIKLQQRDGTRDFASTRYSGNQRKQTSL